MVPDFDPDQVFVAVDVEHDEHHVHVRYPDPPNGWNTLVVHQVTDILVHRPRESAGRPARHGAGSRAV